MEKDADDCGEKACPWCSKAGQAVKAGYGMPYRYTTPNGSLTSRACSHLACLVRLRPAGFKLRPAGFRRRLR